MDIKQEDLIRFWTWCGFKQDELKFNYGEAYLKDETGGYYLLQLNLMNIYKYAIPRLQEKGYDIELTGYADKIFQARIFTIISMDETTNKACVESNNPTEALYKAIMQVIDKETK